MTAVLKEPKAKKSQLHLSYNSEGAEGESKFLNNEIPTLLDDFLKTRKSKHNLAGCPVVYDKSDDYFYCVQNGQIKRARIDVNNNLSHNRDSSYVAGCLILPNLLLLNGDEDTAYIPSDAHDYEGDKITISFECLAQMFKTDANKIMDRIYKEDIVIVDHSEDETKPLTAAQKKIRGNKRHKLKPPEFGFTYVSGKWHRAGWTVFKSEGNFYIMGQDEGSYFCSQLPPCDKKTMTIAEALRLLVPQGATLTDQRQGEWFLVKVDDKDVPGRENCIGFSCDGEIVLPIDDPDANEHSYRGEYRVSRDGTIFVNSGSLIHDQHEELDVPNEWHKFLRNTAVRSVSIQGVD